MFVSILTILITCYLIWRNVATQSILNKSVLWSIFLYKVLLGISVGLIYFYYYKAGDTLGFHRNASVLNDYFLNHPDQFISIYFNTSSIAFLEEKIYYLGQPRALFFIKILSILYLITNSSYWITTFITSSVSFLAILSLLKSIKEVNKEYMLPALISLLILPSVVFWSSGIQKESLMLVLIVVIIDRAIRIVRSGNYVVNALTLVIAAFSLYLLKYYTFALFSLCFLPTLLIFLWQKKTQLKAKKQVVLWGISLVTIASLTTLIHPNLSFNSFLEILISNHQLTLKNSGENALTIHFHHLTPNLLSIIYHAPGAIFYGLFRPFLWESDSFLHYISSLENLFIAALLLIFIICFKRPKSLHLFTISAILYVVLTLIFITISTPNLGTLSRYKIAYLPFLTFLLLSSPMLRKLLHSINTFFLR